TTRITCKKIRVATTAITCGIDWSKRVAGHGCPFLRTCRIFHWPPTNQPENCNAPYIMKCARHNAEAISVCVYCGRALCVDCVQKPSAARMVCSEACATALAVNDQAIQLILQKSLQGLRASAFYCYLCAGLSAAAALVAWFMLPSTFLILFAAGCAV